MKITLSPQDFELRTLEDNQYQYFSYDAEVFEITIEPHALGYDVCQYDHNGLLTGKRKPVLFKDHAKPQDCFANAVSLASEIYQLKVYGRSPLYAFVHA